MIIFSRNYEIFLTIFFDVFRNNKNKKIYYNEKYKCCGNGCDWNSPAFRIEKITDLNYCTWDGLERDYWEYQEQFESNEQNKNKEVEKFKLEQEKQYLKDRINELQEELVNLEMKEKCNEYGNLKLIK